MDVFFGRLIEADLPMLHSWLSEPGVVQWWEGDDVSWEAVVRDDDPNGDDATEHWIALLDDRPPTCTRIEVISVRSGAGARRS